MNSARFEKVLAAPRLPTLPMVAVRVIELTERPDVSLKELAETIQNDQGLAAKVLKTVNSSFYGLPKKCSTINQAMVTLGTHAVKTLALGFSLVNMVKDSQGEKFDYVEYWRRGILSGVGARSIAELPASGAERDEVFLAGVLQDVGMIAMFQALGDEYLAALHGAAGDHGALTNIETSMFGFSHADVSAEMATRWKLPETLVEPIRRHGDASKAPASHAAAARCVALGNISADAFSGERPDAVERFRTLSAEWFGCEPAAADALLTRIRTNAKELADLLRVDVGSIPPAEEILARASEHLVAISMRTEREAETLAQANAELQVAAATDSLTGVANRRRFSEVVAEAFERARRDPSQGACSVVFFDADRFKGVNDSHGHQAGDIVLVELAARMKRCFEPLGGIVCRYGGEEFAIIMAGKARADVARIAESFRAEQEREAIDISAAGSSTPRITVTVSIGVAGIDPSCLDAFATVDLMVRAADQAVYAAKNAGRNCVRVFNPRPKAAVAA